MQFMQQQQELSMSSKMDFKNKIAYQIVTLFGLGRLPGGGTWASLFILFVVIIFEDSSTNALSGEIALYTYIMSFFSFGYLYEKSLPFFDSKDPKEFVLDEIAGMSFAIMIVGLFSWFFGGRERFHDVPGPSGINFALVNGPNGGLASMSDHFLCFLDQS
mgnify:CR=1 FL=1